MDRLPVKTSISTSLPPVPSYFQTVRPCSDRCASVQLSRVHAATSWAVWRTTQRKTVHLTVLLFGGRDDEYPFLLLACVLGGRVTSVPYYYIDTTMQRTGWWCLDTQVWADDLQRTAWTVCFEDMIWETNLICLQPKQGLCGSVSELFNFSLTNQWGQSSLTWPQPAWGQVGHTLALLWWWSI